MNLGEALLNLASGVGYALDTPGAYTRGLLAGRPGERVGGRELLEALGLLAENREGLDVGDVAGFGAEMLLDPLNLLGGAAFGKLFKSAKLAKRGNLARKAMLEAGAMPDDVARLTKIVDDAGMPQRMHHGVAKVFDPDEFASGPEFLRSLEDSTAYGRTPTFVNKTGNYIDARNPIGMNQIGDALESPALTSPIADAMERQILKKRPDLAGMPEALTKHSEDDIYEMFDIFSDDDAATMLELANWRRSGEAPYSGVINMVEEFDLNVPEVLRGAGYDAITQQGSGGLYDTVIPLGARMYEPQIAPAAMRARDPSRLLQALLAYNAGMVPERFQ